jgi:hypothetical protein
MGTSPASPQQPQYAEESGWYVFQKVLTSGQALTGLALPIENDSDFLLTGIHGTSTGAFTVNFRLPGGRTFCNAQIHSANLLGTPNQPTPIGPTAIYRGGSNGPVLDITDVSGAGNTLEIVFSGIRRLKLRN